MNIKRVRDILYFYRSRGLVESIRYELLNYLIRNILLYL